MLCKRHLITLISSAFFLGCSDSKADLVLTTYRIKSDCPGAPAEGKVELTKDSPNVFRATGATAFGFPDDLIHREDQGLLQSKGTSRTCRTRAYGKESEVMFVCLAVPSNNPECTVLMVR